MSSPASAAAKLADPVVWSDVENGAYGADLPVWEDLAATAEGAILELGCGSGRVALHLAGLGFEVVAVDVSPELVAAVNDRASTEGVRVEALVADIRTLDLGRRFGAVLGPMQVVHMLAGSEERAAMLGSVATHLAPGGRAAFALLDEEALEHAYEAAADDLTPDVLEQEGWTYSSRPLAIRSHEGAVEIQRRREVVAPDGASAQAEDVVRLARLSTDEFETEARRVGLVPFEQREIEPTEAHMGSTVVVLSAG